MSMEYNSNVIINVNVINKKTILPDVGIINIDAEKKNVTM
jgi:hypothetical protein